MKATSVTRRFRAALGSAILGITLAAILAACGTPAGAIPATPTATPITPTATTAPPAVVTPSPTVAPPSPPTTTTRPAAFPSPFWCD
ncbi:MAG: hypothetical protein U0232_19470 [Thermomicrobiales bacterium]